MLGRDTDSYGGTVACAPEDDDFITRERQVSACEMVFAGFCWVL